MRYSVCKGVSFGLTSGVITTLGLMVGLYSGTHSTSVVIGGILSIAIADALSDAFGLHVSEEATGVHSLHELWLVALVTFVAKFFFALTFMIPVLLLPLQAAVWASVVWGVVLMGLFSAYMAYTQKKSVCAVVGEHVVVLLLVVLITYVAGSWISNYFM
jgi:vacuolar iron transporter family protein